MTPTRTQRRALRGIALSTRRSDWATSWPGDITEMALKRCVEAGWLEQGKVPSEGIGTFPCIAFRLTDEGRKAMEG